MVQLIPGQHIHFIGIAGAGLSAIARVLIEQGFHVSGSDMNSNALTESLSSEGAVIYQGHNAAYVSDAEMVIRSSAIPDEHTEVLSAQAQGIPVYKRSDVIEALMDGHVNIAIAGTHGKTTTTGMVTHILMEAETHPSYIIGGILASTGKNAGIDNGTAFVIEADEYDNMFHGIRPDIEVITSIEYDHPDFFHSPRDLMNSFSRFIGLLPQDGSLIACVDDPVTSIFARNRFIVHLPVITYSLNNALSDWRAVNIDYEKDVTRFDVMCDGEIKGSVTLTVPGWHNVLNALAALIVVDLQGIPFEKAAQALATFTGTGRRFDVRGEADGIVVVDDYAHHPTAIRAALAAARQRYPAHEIWAVWQPHTFSRTRRLSHAYEVAFQAARHVLVTDIYAAREQQTDEVSSAGLVEMMDHPDARYTGALEHTTEVLINDVRSPALILIMSAGDAPQIGIDFLEQMKNRVS